MTWRIAANGVALVVVVSVTTVVSAATYDLNSTVIDQRKVSDIDAKSALASIKVENEHPNGYRRSLFIHWTDVDGDGCDTREQVLIRDTVTKAQVDPYRCYLVAGDWVSPYDGAKLGNRGDVDIDHLVALKEAWDSGAWNWSEAQREAYANDTTDRRTLIAVTDRANISKGDKDPSNWMPPLRSYWCTYLGDWISVKARWGLSMDQSEYGRIKNLLASDCSSLTIASWSAVPVLANVVGSATSTSSSVAKSAPSTSSSTTTISTVTTATTTTTSATVVKDITPGAYCAPLDAGGSYKGVAYICSKTNAEGTAYSGNRARWRKSTN
ncbi:MAG: HNH endonuclease [Acidimicrobiaceae bacterium]|nr:HNH endonuclease [Acidimicrobiaceae bacterium]